MDIVCLTLVFLFVCGVLGSCLVGTNGFVFVISDIWKGVDGGTETGDGTRLGTTLGTAGGGGVGKDGEVGITMFKLLVREVIWIGGGGGGTECVCITGGVCMVSGGGVTISPLISLDIEFVKMGGGGGGGIILRLLILSV